MIDGSAEYLDVVTWENPEYKDSDEPPSKAVEYNDQKWMESYDPSWDDPPDRGYEFRKRKWKIPRGPRKKKGDEPVVIATKINGTNCKDIIGPVVKEWWEWKQTKVSERALRKVWHMHDNAKYWQAKTTQKWFKEQGIPIYPPGGVYGYHFGFPPHSPDLNCVAEYAIGFIKLHVARALSKLTEDERRGQTQKKLAALVQKARAEIYYEDILAWREAMENHIEECFDHGGKYGPSVRGVRRTSHVRSAN